MKIPKKIKHYCKKCKKHTEHKLKEFKSGRARTTAKGQRRHKRHTRGYGGRYQYIATVKKQGKKPTFLAECTTCKAKSYFVIPKRMKKAELA